MNVWCESKSQNLSQIALVDAVIAPGIPIGLGRHDDRLMESQAATECGVGCLQLFGTELLLDIWQADRLTEGRLDHFARNIARGCVNGWPFGSLRTDQGQFDLGGRPD